MKVKQYENSNEKNTSLFYLNNSSEEFKKIILFHNIHVTFAINL